MTASITLIGEHLAQYEPSFQAWLTTQQLETSRKILTNPQDAFSVLRYDLSTPLADGKYEALRAELLALADQTSIDHVLQCATPEIRQVGLAVFDMDSTLIKAEVMDELAVEMGIGEQIAAVTTSAMRGEIDFVESFTQRLSLLDGLSSGVMDTVYQRIEHMDGISKLMKVLHHFGWKTAILSGGFTYFADRVQSDHGMTEVHANVLEIFDDKLTGNYVGPIVDAKRKQVLLAELAQKYAVPSSQTIACGDGANDLLMLKDAALGVALHAKPIVRQQAPCPMSQLGLDGVLYLLGMSSDEIAEIVNA
ncbi:Phosphoserine phosphatase [Marinomonas aquimarina]|uniref:Phosphoserine phosphatase n=1 Tax=Marinomonas aquimarina TaxID=295068 RepID=A0A1A8SYR1_9GAMM|nr:phosphoserine phosphatase SerB [Marinomonas aquimarina]SBS24550.1 Phosphoserine phosphatase [Marinomonas aquimarina]